MMRAEFFVFHYGMALLDALFTVRKDLGYDGGVLLATDDVVIKSFTSKCFIKGVIQTVFIIVSKYLQNIRINWPI